MLIFSAAKHGRRGGKAGAIRWSCWPKIEWNDTRHGIGAGTSLHRKYYELEASYRFWFWESVYPSPQEIGFCLPYLKAQLSIQPKVIVALGNTAIQALLSDTTLKVGRVRGNWFEFSVPMLPTFHPSYILHNESNRTKRMVWEDLLKVMERLDLPISDKQRAYFL